MTYTEITLLLVAGGGVGWLVGFLFLSRKISSERQRAILAEQQVSLNTQSHEQELQNLKNSYEQRISDLQITEQKLSTTFKATAATVLQENAKQFTESAVKDLNVVKAETSGEVNKHKQDITTAISQLASKLDDANQKIAKFETERTTLYSSLNTQIQSLSEQEKQLITETGHLKSALTTSHSVRGRWGELVLRNILTACGLVEGIDYVEQKRVPTEDGKWEKPDFILKLPNSENQLAIDAKTPLYDSYLESEKATTDEEREKCHEAYVEKLKERIKDLSSKEYDKYVSAAVPYVVMFIPSEAAIRAAFDTDPDLFKNAAAKRVVISSPATIIPLILVVASAWKQFKLSADALQLQKIVKELGSRLETFVDRLSTVQKGIEMAAGGWNEAIGKSWLGGQNVMKSFEKVKQLGNLQEIKELSCVSSTLVALPEEKKPQSA
ncbi:MAG: DNA recombination protein RmuC [Candidatus Peribacteraceae bacterium]|nr:DNA recombination protein RmuC [Candidatus Peribacteraceae bacterium]MDD5742769.1 DNA recombination protein RmuC [Candidatus Peribacteraceae bacterium]